MNITDAVISSIHAEAGSLAYVTTASFIRLERVSVQRATNIRAGVIYLFVSNLEMHSSSITTFNTTSI